MPKKDEQLETKGKEQKPGELYFLISIAIIAIVLLFESFKQEGILQGSYSGPGFIPQLMSIAIVLMVGIIIIKHIRTNSNHYVSEFTDTLKFLFSREVITLLVLIILYAVLLEKLHFKLTTFLFLFIAMFLFDRQKPFQKLLISLGMLGFIVVIFSSIFKVLLP